MRGSYWHAQREVAGSRLKGILLHWGRIVVWHSLDLSLLCRPQTWGEQGMGLAQQGRFREQIPCFLSAGSGWAGSSWTCMGSLSVPGRSVLCFAPKKEKRKKRQPLPKFSVM